MQACKELEIWHRTQACPGIRRKRLYTIKGVLHPRPVFRLFMHFSQKLQHIGDKLDMFLLGNILGNLITALEFTNSSGYWFMVQNMQNIDFRTFFTITSQQWPLLK